MSVANVLIDSSQFPEKVQAQLLESLRSRRINHKFHYDSYKQAQKWLALHEAHSPARRDADCLRIYEESFAAAVKQITAKVHVIGLGCGGGQKEAALLRRIGSRTVLYSPCDVSLPLVLTATKAAGDIVGETCSPVVCDLAEADNLEGLFQTDEGASRLITFFGMIPNFEPDVILPKLASLLRGEDVLLFSANLSPGDDYLAGVQKILPQYDNTLTHDWLMTFLLDLGVAYDDGQLLFSIEEAAKHFRRVVAKFKFAKKREIQIGMSPTCFNPGEAIRLFFSYRYQPQQIIDMLKAYRIRVIDQWLAGSQEEGVFACSRE